MEDEMPTGYIKVRLDYAPKTNGKKFAEWCKKYDFDPLNSGRRAWCSSLRTYLRGASGVAFADGEMFLFDEEDLLDLDHHIVAARIDEVEKVKLVTYRPEMVRYADKRQRVLRQQYKTGKGS